MNLVNSQADLDKLVALFDWSDSFIQAMDYRSAERLIIESGMAVFDSITLEGNSLLLDLAIPAAPCIVRLRLSGRVMISLHAMTDLEFRGEFSSTGVVLKFGPELHDGWVSAQQLSWEVVRVPTRCVDDQGEGGA